MKKITTIVGAVVAAIIVLTTTTYGFALTSTVEQVVNENMPMRGLFLKVSKDLQAERLKLARSRASLREFPRRRKQWDAKLTSIEAQIESIKEKIAAGLSLIETGEQSFDVGGNRYTKQQLELDLNSKADMLRSLRERKMSAVETLKAIDCQEKKATAIITESETAVAKLEIPLTMGVNNGISASSSEIPDFDKLEFGSGILMNLVPLCGPPRRTAFRQPYKLHYWDYINSESEMRQLLDGHRSQSGGVNYVEPRSEIDLEAIKALLN